MQYCKINNTNYPAMAFNGRMADPDWDFRETVLIHLPMTYEQATQTFIDGRPWSIVEINDETMEETEFDNSDFSLAGDITDHRDGTVSVKMGKLTDLEEAYLLLYGGEE